MVAWLPSALHVILLSEGRWYFSILKWALLKLFLVTYLSAQNLVLSLWLSDRSTPHVRHDVGRGMRLDISYQLAHLKKISVPTTHFRSPPRGRIDEWLEWSSGSKTVSCVC